MSQDQQTYRRATHAALVGLLVQAVLAGAMWLIGLWSASPAVHAAAIHLGVGLPIWFILLLLYNQHRIERAEALEVEELSRADVQTAAIFEEHADDLQLARQRLRTLQTWGLNVVSLLVAGLLLAVGSWLLYTGVQSVTTMQVVSTIRSSEPDAPPQQVTRDVPISAAQLKAIAMSADASPMALMFLCLAIAFIAFIVARYVAGMTKEQAWQLLRGGAGYLMGSALVALLAGLGALLAFLGYRQVLAYMAVVIPAIMFLIGLEVLVNFLLSAYRPRKPGEVPRPAFDSRVLGLLTSPESIASAINEAINYQFGFEVSRSWFYQLLARAVTPLFVFGLVILVLISSIVIVAPHEQGVITTFGGLGDPPRVENPGFHLKWPWPVGRVQRLPVGQIQQIEFGSAVGGLDTSRAILWTNPHGQGAEDFFTVPQSEHLLVRGIGSAFADIESEIPRELIEDEEQDARNRAPGTSLMGVQVVVQYRISDVLDYVRSAADPAELLRTLSEEAANNHFVTKDIDTLLGDGRITAGGDLRRIIGAIADDYRLGVEIVFVGLQGVHPPQEGGVAEAFLKQIGALQDQQAAIQEAQRRRTEILATVVGSEDRAFRINHAVVSLNDLRAKVTASAIGSPERDAAEKALAEQEADIERMLAQAGGTASQVIYDAIAYRWRASVHAKAEADAFQAQLATFKLVPDLYRTKLYYETLIDGLSNARKYVVDPQATTAPVYRIDLKDAKSSLDSALGLDRE